MHFLEGIDRFANVFKDIMSKDDIKGFSGKSQFIDVATFEVDIGNALRTRSTRCAAHFTTEDFHAFLFAGRGRTLRAIVELHGAAAQS
jgi:hypothetical protein